jgi:hypothetical protein
MDVKTHKFKGVTYYIHVDSDLDGVCDDPKTKRVSEYPGIFLTKELPFGNQKGARKGLISLIHECMHATKFPGRENDIERASDEIGKLLWRLGYRRKR